MLPNKEQLEALRRKYPTGTKIILHRIPDTPDVPDIPTGDTTSRLPGYALITAGLALMVFALMRDASIRRKKKDSNADKYAALCPDFIEREE